MVEAKINYYETEESKSEDWREELQELKDEENPYGDVIERLETSINTYEEQIETLLKSQNPFKNQIDSCVQWITDATRELQILTAKHNTESYRLRALEQLQDLSGELRVSLLTNAVSRLQQDTNRLLSKYFDAEFTVSFSAQDADKIDVVIYKGESECNYKQLSKGQRQLLKLCFAVSTMEYAAEQSGIHMDNLFFDEALDGLDAALKIKAHSLFEELATKHQSVYVIEHTPEFQELFSVQYCVQLDAELGSIMTII